MHDRLDGRKESILRVIVDEHVKTAEPVGSNQVVRAAGLTASPATIRNDMASLEQDGYLVQPHVSAGRIPTDKGYRYIVDQIEPNATLNIGHASFLSDFFDHATRELEFLVAESSRVLSELTNCTSVVTTANAMSSVVKHVQLVELTSGTAMGIVVLSSGAVEKEVFDLPDGVEVAEEDYHHASAELTQRWRGSPLGSVDRIETPESTTLATYASSILRERLSVQPEELRVTDSSKVANSFLTVAKVSQILETLEKQVLVVSLIRSVLDRGQNVSIGNENGLETLLDCALVIAPFEIGGERVGSIGIIGPTRMNYPLALAAVRQAGKGIGKVLVEG